MFSDKSIFFLFCFVGSPLLRLAAGRKCYDCVMSESRQTDEEVEACRDPGSNFIRDCMPDENLCLNFTGKLDGRFAGARLCLKDSPTFLKHISGPNQCLPTSSPLLKDLFAFKIAGTELEDGYMCVCDTDYCNRNGESQVRPGLGLAVIGGVMAVTFPFMSIALSC